MHARGEVTHVVRSPTGQPITNRLFRPGTTEITLTDSGQGVVLTARFPSLRAGLFSHS